MEKTVSSPVDPRRLLEDFNKILSEVPPGDLTHIHPDSREGIVRMMARKGQLCHANFRKYLEHPSFFIGDSITLDILPDDEPKNCEFVDRIYYDFLDFLSSLLYMNSDLADRVTTLRLILPSMETVKVNVLNSIGRSFRHKLIDLMIKNIISSPPKFLTYRERFKDKVAPNCIADVYKYNVPRYSGFYEDLRKILAPIALCRNLKCLTVAFPGSSTKGDRPKQLLWLFSKDGATPEVADVHHLRLSNTTSYADLDDQDKCLVDALPSTCFVEFNFGTNRHNLKLPQPLYSGTVLQDLFSALCACGPSSLEELELLNQHFDCNLNLEHNERAVLRKLKRLTWECFGVFSSNIHRFLDYCETLECLKISFGPGYLLEVPMKLHKLRHLTVVKDRLSTCEVSKVGESNRLLFHWTISYPLEVDSDALKWMLQHDVEVSIDARINFLKPWLRKDWIIPAGNYITSLNLTKHVNLTLEAADTFIENCRNLQSVKVNCFAIVFDSPIVDYFLNKLFADKDRAMKLRCLKIYDRMSDDTLKLLFSNCNKLKVLTINGNKINDKHTQLLINGGAKPSKIVFSSTDLSDTGLIALIVACGSKLRKLSVFDIILNDPNAVIETLIRHCPLLEYINCGKNINSKFSNNYDVISRKFISSVKIL